MHRDGAQFPRIPVPHLLGAGAGTHQQAIVWGVLVVSSPLRAPPMSVST